MSILDRYIMKGMLLPFFIGLAGFLVFISVELLYQLSDIILRNKIPIVNLFILIYYNIPAFTVMGLPVGVLFAIFWLISQLSTNNELLAFEVNGISKKRVIIPFLIVGVLLSFLNFFLGDYLVPSFNEKANRMTREIIYRKPNIAIRENTFFKKQDEYFYVEKFNRKTQTFENVVIYDTSGENLKMITAKKANEESGKWFLYNARIYVTDKEGKMTLNGKFDKMEFDLKEEVRRFLTYQKGPRDMSTKELKEHMKIFKRLGLDTTVYETEYYAKYAVALGPIIIVLVGVPLSLIFDISSKATGIILTFILIVLYQGSTAWLTAMAENKLLSPFWGAWLPDIVFLITGFLLFLILGTKLLYRVRELFSRLFIIAIPILLLPLLFSPAKVWAAEEVVNIEAATITYNAHTDALTAVGSVTVDYKDDHIFAPRLDMKDRVITITGPATVISKQGTQTATWTAIKLKVNLDKDAYLVLKMRGVTKMKFKEKSGKLKEHTVYYFGEKTENATDTKGKECWNIGNGFITTCDLKHPHYEFRASKIRLYPNDYLIAYDVVFVVLDVPIMYLPVYYVNLNGEKKQPLEFHFGYDENSGFYVQVKFNYYLSKDQPGSTAYNWYQKKYRALTIEQTLKFLGIGGYFKYYQKNPVDSEQNVKALSLSFSKQLNKNMKAMTSYDYSESKQNNTLTLSLTGSFSKNTGYSLKYSEVKPLLGVMEEKPFAITDTAPAISFYAKNLHLKLPFSSALDLKNFNISYTDSKSASYSSGGESITATSTRQTGSMNTYISTRNTLFVLSNTTHSLYSSFNRTSRATPTYSLKQDNILTFHPIRFRVGNLLNFSESYKMAYGVEVKNLTSEQLTDLASEIATNPAKAPPKNLHGRWANELITGLTVKPFNWMTLKATHLFDYVKGQGMSDFKMRFNRNKLALEGNTKLGPLSTTAKTGYDLGYEFRPPKRPWNDLNISNILKGNILAPFTLSNETILDINEACSATDINKAILKRSDFSFNTNLMKVLVKFSTNMEFNTSIESLKMKKTDFKLSLNKIPWAWTSSTSYFNDTSSTPTFGTLKNMFTWISKDKKHSLRLNLNFEHADLSSLEYFSLSYRERRYPHVFKLADFMPTLSTTNTFSPLYLLADLPIALNAVIDYSYQPSRFKNELGFTLLFIKDLHCWESKGYIKGKWDLNSGKLTPSFEIQFYIKDFPEKTTTFFEKEGKPGIRLGGF